MTDTGRQQQMGAAVEELGDLRKELACLVTKAEVCQGACRGAMAHLERAIGDEATGKDRGGCTADTWPSYDDIVRLHDDIKQTKGRIEQLEGRFREWGVIR